MKPTILFLLPYPLHKAPSQRFRVEAFFNLLHQQGITYKTAEFLSASAWKVLYQKGSTLQKAAAIIKGFIKRLFIVLFTAYKYDYIFIHREAAPLGPPVFEWLLAKVFRKKLIFDFDDAIWIPNTSESNKIASYVKCFWKVALICKWSYKVSAGNAYLANWAKQHHSKVVINPTCVDMVGRFNQLKKQETNKLVIGWTGSHSTLKYLDELVPVLQNLETKHHFEFLVICNQPPLFQLGSLRFIKWQESTEIKDLLNINIGVMPLVNDTWSEGKCGFKLIQYLALGIPAVASPVGVNKEIITEGGNGFLCTTKDEWTAALEGLLTNAPLRTNLGVAGHQKIAQQYSIESNAANFLSLFQ